MYRCCYDMYQFGKLIVDIEDASLWQLKLNLQSSNVAERYTAEKSVDLSFRHAGSGTRWLFEINGAVGQLSSIEL